MFHDLAFEDPGFDPDDAVSGRRFNMRVIDVGTQSVERHAAFTWRDGKRPGVPAVVRWIHQQGLRPALACALQRC